MCKIKVWQDGEQAYTSSRNVAEIFDKQHKHVLDACDKLIDVLDSSFREPNFRLSEYTTGDGNFRKTHREYLLTKDGFTLLAMGFSGKRALQFKVDYISAFNTLLKHTISNYQLNQDLHFKLISIVERQDAMMDYMRDDIQAMHEHVILVQKYLEKARTASRMVELLQGEAMEKRQNINALVAEVGKLCQEYGVPNPVAFLSLPASKLSKRKRRKSKGGKE